jgi:hypothetical protein
MMRVLVMFHLHHLLKIVAEKVIDFQADIEHEDVKDFDGHETIDHRVLKTIDDLVY